MNPVRWQFALLLAALHVAALMAWRMATPSAVVLCMAWGGVVQLAITLGYHRLFSHRSYRARPWLRYLLAVICSQSIQGGPITWAAVHRQHHGHADAEGDPHSPNVSFWWSHLGWTTRETPVRHDPSLKARYCPDLMAEPILVWLDDYYLWLAALAAFVLFRLGGWPWLLWGVAVRLVLNMHATALINSVTHCFGYRNFKTGDRSRNNPWVAMVTFGEGWHNNHHARPASVTFQQQWWEIDLAWICLTCMEKLGWVSDLHYNPEKN